jgi:hypothetical protein
MDFQVCNVDVQRKVMTSWDSFSLSLVDERMVATLVGGVRGDGYNTNNIQCKL